MCSGSLGRLGSQKMVSVLPTCVGSDYLCSGERKAGNSGSCGTPVSVRKYLVCSVNDGHLKGDLSIFCTTWRLLRTS